MKLYREIRIQKLQTKNRMVGKTFNPSGHTSQSLDERERLEIARIKQLSNDELNSLREAYKACDLMKLENNIYYSNSFEQNVFKRNFGY